MKKLGLLPKLIIIIIIPLIIILILTGMTMQDIGDIVASRVEKTNLDTANYTIQTILCILDDGDYYVENDELYKGNINLSTYSETLDQLKDNTDVDVTIFSGAKRVATTIKGSDGKRILGTSITDELYSRICDEKSVFVSDGMVNDEPYYGYYEVVSTLSNGDKVLVFTGVDQASITEIYFKRINSTMVFFSVLIIIFCIIIAFFIRAIVKNIITSIGYLYTVTDGNLDVKVDDKIINRSDEVGTMANSINKLIDRFIGIVHSLVANSKALTSFSDTIEETFSDIHNSVRDVNRAVDEIAQGATTQAKDANEVNDEITEMGKAVDKASISITNLNEIKKDMENSNKEVSHTLQDLGEISEHTQLVIKQVYDQTNETNEAAQEINGVIDMIQEIASQTNLLSLNASIEAARAGEAGKGFSVVADEVRKLAEQSEASAKQISEIVIALMTKTSEGVSSMENVMKENQLQKEKLEITQTAFTELNKEIQKVATEVENIKFEIQNIDTSKDVVLDKITKLVSVSTESAASTEETAASMEKVEALVNACTERLTKLADICDSLNENINQFELPKNE